MFGFTCQFVENKESIQKTNKAEIPWKSMSEFSKLLRKIGRNLRSLKHFDDAMNNLENVLNVLTDNGILNKCEWITENNRMTIRNLVFVHIETIGHIFVENHQQNATKSLKTDIKNYQNFFKNLSILLSSNSLNVFTKKQLKQINTLKELVISYNNDCELSIVEKQYNLLRQKHIDNDNNNNNIELIQKLRLKLSKTRIDRCEMVLKHRTDRIILILDQCYDVRNQCAMLRSAELFGIQNIWIVKPINYKNMKVYDSISRRSQLWLTLRYFNSSLQCINALKNEEKHRKIWVMDIGKDAMELSTKIIDEYRNKKRIFPEYVAIIMGKEAEGPSKEFLKYCDQKVYLPQFGFCESFNVSVACALGLQSIFSMDDNIRGKMNENQRNKLRYLWYYQLVNDKEIKKEMNQLIDKTVVLNENDRNNNDDNSLQNDFRRNEFKHWDAKKINFRLRKKLQEQQTQNFLDSISNQ